ncbi:MAG: RrF2 family transcriptional regulator [Planctomycetota bacterium]|jgi:Rrf2 family protein
MLSLSRKTDYALVALAGLVDHELAGSSARDLADELHLPLPALRNILKRLTQQGFLTSTQGPKGGYRLARRPEEITLGQLVEAIDGPVHLAMCCPVTVSAEQPQCELEPSCRIKATVRQVHGGLINYLDQVTLADIVAARVGSALVPAAADGGVIPENV